MARKVNELEKLTLAVEASVRRNGEDLIVPPQPMPPCDEGSGEGDAADREASPALEISEPSNPDDDTPPEARRWRAEGG